jgi:hypothetical protein
MVALSCFLAVAFMRLIDGDEGYYLLAARLVFAGHRPYADFFFPQMFLTPYVYGAWLGLIGTTWYAGRALSALLAMILTVLVYRAAVQTARRRGPAVFAVALFLFSELSLAWLTVVKTYALSAVLLFAAFMLARRTELHRSHALLLGALLGLGVDTRLYIAGVVPLFVASLWRRRVANTEKRAAAPFLAGLALTLLPNVVFLAADPQAFLFGTLGYHSFRSAGGLIGEPGQKLAVLLHLLGGDGSIDGVRLAVIFVPSLIYSLVMIFRRRAVPLSATLELGLVGLLLLPTPTFTQYFALVFPFAVVNVAALIAAAQQRLVGEDRRAARAWHGGLAIAAVLYLAAVPDLVVRYTLTGEGVIGILTPALASDWRITTVREVSQTMERAAPEPGLALVWWPGYLVESTRGPLPGTENHFGRPVAPLLPPGQAHRQHLASEPELLRAIDEAVPEVIVLGNDVLGEERLEAGEHLQRSRYRHFAWIGNAEVWARRRRPGG